MAISSLTTDWGSNPRIVRVTTDDSLATITTSGYLTGTVVAASIEDINKGAFDWLEGDLAAINFSNGEGFFTHDSTTNAFVAETIPGSLSSTLANGAIFVGDAVNTAVGVTPSGDVTVSNTGVTAIGAAKVTKAMLVATVRPSHMIVFASQVTTIGGAAAEAFVVTGAVAATDRAFVQIVDNGTGNVTVLQAVVTAGTLTITFSGDPGNNTIFNYQLIRATA